jgi:hypothetical protein
LHWVLALVMVLHGLVLNVFLLLRVGKVYLLDWQSALV